MSSSDPGAGGASAPMTTGWSIAAGLTLWYTASAFLLVALATGLLYWVLVRNVDREDDQFLVDTVQILRALIRERPDDTASLRQEVEWEGAARRYARVYIRVLDTDGRVVARTPGASASMWRQQPEAAAPGLEAGPGVDGRSPTGTPFRMLAAWAPVGPAGRDRRLIQIALDRTAERQLLAKYRARLWSVLGLALLAAGAVGYSIARHGIRPIEAMTTTARDIRSSTLDRRMPTGGLPAELSSLAETFNQMMNRLEDAFARLSSLSADLAHELRTPINNLRGEVEVSLGKPRSAAEYREALESVLEECVRLSHMIDGLMFLARADSPETQVVRTPLDIPRELMAVREFFEPAATEAGVSFEVEAPDGPTVAALDRTLVQRALSNLITNALTHTPAGGRIRLTATRNRRELQIEVSDTGVGISAEHLARVSDRFYRVDRSRSSGAGELGLGLAIVKSIMGVHGGSLEILSERGRGTTARLSFPDAVLEQQPSPAVGEAAVAEDLVRGIASADSLERS